MICPIIHDIPRDPIVAGDGHIYSQRALKEWLNKHEKSPITNEIIDPDQLLPVTAITNICNDLRETNLASMLETETSYIHINMQKEKAKVQRYVMNLAFKFDCVIFGSSAYNSFLHEGNIIHFYERCNEQDIDPDSVYNDISFDSSTFNSRRRIMQDIDILMPDTSTLEKFIKKLKITESIKVEEIPIKVDDINSSYFTDFQSNFSIRSFIIRIPFGFTGKGMQVKIDAILPKSLRRFFSLSLSGGGGECLSDKGEYLFKGFGPFPNIIKTIALENKRYFFMHNPELDVDRTYLALEACKYLAESQTTVTTYLDHTKPCNHDNSRESFLMYFRRLVKELKADTTILNLSITLEDDNEKPSLEFQSFDEDGNRQGNINLLISDVYNKIRNASSSNLQKGRLELFADDEFQPRFIHLLCDPDFILDKKIKFLLHTVPYH